MKRRSSIYHVGTREEFLMIMRNYPLLFASAHVILKRKNVCERGWMTPYIYFEWEPKRPTIHASNRWEPSQLKMHVPGELRRMSSRNITL